MQVSDVSDTSGPPYGLEAVTASMTGHKRMFWDAKYTDFLRFRIAVLVPIHPRRPAIHHIPHRTHEAGTYSQTVLPLAPAMGSHLFNFPGHTGRPTGGKVHTFKHGALRLLSRSEFRGKRYLFSKVDLELSFKALFDCVSSIGLEAQKVNNQF